MTDRQHTWAPAAALAALLALACGGDSEQGASPAGDAEAGWTVEAAPSPGKFSADRDGNLAVRPHETDTLPADFPEDVPQYPGAEVRSARAKTGDGMSVSLTSSDDIDKVASFYADTFAARGWATDIRRTPEGQAIFADKGNRTASALVRSDAEGGGTVVEVIVVAR